MAEHNERGLGRLLTASGWKRAEGERDSSVLLALVNRRYVPPAEMQAIAREFQQVEIVDGINGDTAALAALARATIASGRERANVTVGGEPRVVAVLGNRRCGKTAALEAAAAEALVEPGGTRGYLRHDPTKNTKRRMRRAKGRK